MAKHLFVPLNRAPFYAFVDGSKTWEIRRDEGQWAKAVTGMPALLRLGYSGNGELRCVIGRVIRAPGAGQLLSALPSWQQAIPWGQSLEHAAQYVRGLLLTGNHKDKPLVAIEMIQSQEPAK